MIHSLAGLLLEGGISRTRPFRGAAPHRLHGGHRRRGAKRREISLAHNDVLFMDEFPEFPKPVLETLRRPVETGRVVVARANAYVRYPYRFMLVAAANPCHCGHLADSACAEVPPCGQEYLGRISGPLMDCFDLRVEVPPVTFQDLDLPALGDSSAEAGARVVAARTTRARRFAGHESARLNTVAKGRLLEEVAEPCGEGKEYLSRVAARIGLSAPGYHWVLRVARTIADLDDGSDRVRRSHVAGAVGYRLALSGEV